MSQLAEYADRLDQQYQTRFAGHPRFSRDPSLLRRMANEAKQQLNASSTDQEQTAGRDRLLRQIELFETEARSIDEVQSASPEDFLGHEYRSWLDLIFSRYRRNFAAQSRSDRPLNLLKTLQKEVMKISEQLDKVRSRGTSDIITATSQTAQEHRTLFDSEIAAIEQLRTDGDIGSQTSLLANDANRLFGEWTSYFASKSRLSRRISRLEMMIEHLMWIQSQMDRLIKLGDPEQVNEKNRTICEQRIEFYRSELVQIKQARSQSSFDQIVLGLGESANQAFAQYRENFAGQDRSSVSLDTLNVICEELFDLASQMNELDMVRSHDANQQNLATVLDQLRLFQKEYDMIRQVQEES